jgi:hypothetical protein
MKEKEDMQPGSLPIRTLISYVAMKDISNLLYLLASFLFTNMAALVPFYLSASGPGSIWHIVYFE